MGNDDYLGWNIGNFQLVQRLDSGSFGVVYLARNRYVAEHIVAIKLMKTIGVASEEEQDKFLHEAGFLVKLRHPHILPMTDCGILPTAPGSNGKIPYIVTEFAAQGSLRQRLKKQPGRPLPTTEALQILSQVGQALQYAHQQNIVHRDIKPENILFDAPDNALLADFGIAVIVPQGTINVGLVSGSLLYMAPEQFTGIVSRKSDQYALACIAYELLTGRQPFVADDFNILLLKHQTEAPVPPRQINAQIPEYVEQAILRALAKDRMQRFDDVAAFIRAIGAPTAPLATAALNGPAGRVELKMAEVTIGRAPDNRYVLADQQVSGHHAVIRSSPDGPGHTITDLGSMNGTFLNGQPQRLNPNIAYPLKPGEKIRVGQGQSLLIYEAIRPAQTGETVIVPPSPSPFPCPPASSGNSWLDRGQRLWASASAYPRFKQAMHMGRGVWANPRQRTIGIAICAVLIVGLILLIAWPRPTLYDIATSGTPQIPNLFNNSPNTYNWNTSSNPINSSVGAGTGSCGFSGKLYEAVLSGSIPTGEIQFCPSTAHEIDFAYQVTMTIQQGDEGCLLLRFVFQSGVDKSPAYSAYCISSNGAYKFITQQLNAASYQPQGSGSSAAIVTGLHQSNVVTVIVQGSTYTLYVNSKFVVAENSTVSGQGVLGVGVLYDSDDTTVAFSNGKVWQL